MPTDHFPVGTWVGYPYLVWAGGPVPWGDKARPGGGGAQVNKFEQVQVVVTWEWKHYLLATYEPVFSVLSRYSQIWAILSSLELSPAPSKEMKLFK